MTHKQQVVRYCHGHGIAVNSKGGIPLLGKGDWFECFDNWRQALAFLVNARNKHFDNLVPYPWGI